MKPEHNLWQQVKRNNKRVVWTRIESNTGLGIPDLFGFYIRPFWVELKIIRNNKLLFSPHQISWIHKHYNIGCPVFVLAKAPLTGSVQLYPGAIVRDPTSIADKPPLWDSKHGTWPQLQELLGTWRAPSPVKSTDLH